MKVRLNIVFKVHYVNGLLVTGREDIPSDLTSKVFVIMY